MGNRSRLAAKGLVIDAPTARPGTLTRNGRTAEMGAENVETPAPGFSPACAALKGGATSSTHLPDTTLALQTRLTIACSGGQAYVTDSRVE